MQTMYAKQWAFLKPAIISISVLLVVMGSIALSEYYGVLFHQHPSFGAFFVIRDASLLQVAIALTAIAFMVLRNGPRLRAGKKFFLLDMAVIFMALASLCDAIAVVKFAQGATLSYDAFKMFQEVFLATAVALPLFGLWLLHRGHSVLDW